MQEWTSLQGLFVSKQLKNPRPKAEEVSRRREIKLLFRRHCVVSVLHPSACLLQDSSELSRQDKLGNFGCVLLLVQEQVLFLLNHPSPGSF